MSVIDLFMPMIPRHVRLLTRLVEQLQIDPFGSIGWRGLMDEDETFTVDQLFKPLLERGLVEDCTREMGPGGTYFVHITRTGRACLGFGMMLKEARPLTDDETGKYLPGADPAPDAERRRIVANL